MLDAPKKVRSLERFQEISAYLKVRRARRERAVQIELAWRIHRGLSRPRACDDPNFDHARAAAVREQLRSKHAAQGGFCFYCEGPTWLPHTPNGFSISDGEDATRASRRRTMTKATREHLVRIADGGTDDDSNIVMACADCNSRRGEASVTEWKSARKPEAEGVAA